ncbi:Hypothetical protein RMP42_05933 (plasmid) [Roseomonas mucosa]|nr:Hypothetical protein RMP42_05933 [Roseomonas mucosa]
MAGRVAGGAGATGSEVAAELARLRQSVDELTSGLQAMLETQATQTEMIRRLLQAATAPADGEVPLAQLLERVADQVGVQNLRVESLTTMLRLLPGEIAMGVGREFERALASVR